MHLLYFLWPSFRLFFFQIFSPLLFLEVFFLKMADIFNESIPFHSQSFTGFTNTVLIFGPWKSPQGGYKLDSTVPSLRPPSISRRPRILLNLRMMCLRSSLSLSCSDLCLEHKFRFNYSKNLVRTLKRRPRIYLPVPVTRFPCYTQATTVTASCSSWTVDVTCQFKQVSVYTL